MSKENQAYLKLCEMTDGLAKEFGGRSYAFKEACRRRPDLAAAAIDPTGAPISPAMRDATPQKSKSATATPATSPLLLAAERAAAEYQARTKR